MSRKNKSAGAPATTAEKQRVLVRTTLGTNMLVLVPPSSLVSKLKGGPSS